MSSPLRPTHVRPVALTELTDAVDGLTVATPVDGTPAGGSAAGADPTLTAVTGVTLNSRAVEPGDLYAALPGANVHGARFIDAAARSGAAAVLTDAAGLAIARAAGADGLPVLLADDPRAVLGAVSAEIYGRPGDRLTLVGITGTNGKTTTAYILDAALRELQRPTGLIGTIATRIGTRRLKSERTTPESSDLHGIFGLMLDEGVEVVTMEVSSHALSLHRVDGVVYDVAAFTNLSQDHLDFHATMADYFQAKAQLFTPERARRAVVVVDDEWGRTLSTQATIPVTRLASAAATEAEWHILAEPGDSDFELVGPAARVSLTSSLPGDFNRVNTAVAALILLDLGYDPQDVRRGLAADPAVPGRMERVDLGPAAPLAYVDFAHTPDAIALTLAALRRRTAGPLVAVVGAGGARDQGKRPAMGRAAALGADLVVVTDDNPRHEDPASIRAAVLAGALAARPGDAVVEVAGRSQGVELALRLAGPDGTVAVLGKGHEQGQEIAGTIHPYDDRTALEHGWATVKGGAQ